MNLVTKALKVIDYTLTVVGEFALSEPFDIFQHHGRRADLAYEPKRFGEQIPLVRSTELTPRYRERWARHSTCQKINAVELSTIQFSDVNVTYIPVRPVQP